MTREEAIEKIKKLQTLKEGASKVNSEGEMRNAATIIDKLQKQFGITMEEVYGSSSYSNNDAEDDDYEDEDEEYDEQVDENIETIRRNISKGLRRIARRHSSITDPDKKREVIDKAFNDYEYSILSNENLQEKCHNFDIHLSYWFDTERENVEKYLEETGYFDGKYVNYKVKNDLTDDDDRPKKKVLNLNINWEKILSFAAILFIVFFLKAIAGGPAKNYQRQSSSYTTSSGNYGDGYSRTRTYDKDLEEAAEKGAAKSNKTAAERLIREAESGEKAE